jgi:hypothetical protein
MTNFSGFEVLSFASVALLEQRFFFKYSLLDMDVLFSRNGSILCGLSVLNFLWHMYPCLNISDCEFFESSVSCLWLSGGSHPSHCPQRTHLWCFCFNILSEHKGTNECIMGMLCQTALCNRSVRIFMSKNPERIFGMGKCTMWIFTKQLIFRTYTHVT